MDTFFCSISVQIRGIPLYFPVPSYNNVRLSDFIADCIFCCIIQVWQEFTSFPEEEQGAILGGSWRSPPIQGGKGVSRKGGSVEDRYSIIDRHIRNMLKHNKHLPHVSRE